MTRQTLLLRVGRSGEPRSGITPALTLLPEASNAPCTTLFRLWTPEAGPATIAKVEPARQASLRTSKRNPRHAATDSPGQLSRPAEGKYPDCLADKVRDDHNEGDFTRS